MVETQLQAEHTDAIMHMNKFEGFHMCCLRGEKRRHCLNDRMLNLLGYTKDEFNNVYNGDYVELILPDYKEAYLQFVKDMAALETSESIEYGIKCKSGEILYFREIMTSRTIDNGRMCGFCAIENITDQVKDGAVGNGKPEATPYGIMFCTCDEYPRIKYINREMLKLIGASQFSDYKLYADNILFMVTHNCRESFVNILEEAKASGIPQFINNEIVRIDGSNARLSGWVWTVTNNDGEKELRFFYVPVYNALKTETDKEIAYVQANKQSYNIIIKIDHNTDTAQCIHKTTHRSIGVSCDITFTIDSAKKHFLNNYIIPEDHNTASDFIDRAINQKNDNVFNKEIHTVFSATLEDGDVRNYRVTGITLNRNTTLICIKDITDTGYSKELLNKSRVLKKLWDYLDKVTLTSDIDTVAFEIKDRTIFPIYFSEKCCRRMRIDKQEFLNIADKGISFDEFFGRFGITEYDFNRALKGGSIDLTVVEQNGVTATYNARTYICDPETSDIYTVFFSDPQKINSAELLRKAKSRAVNPKNISEKKDSFVPGNDAKIWIRTFGNFDVFVNGVPMRFSSAKAKELLAILVDRRGGSLTAEEAISYLWEDKAADKQVMSNYRKVAMRMHNTLDEFGIGDLVINDRGIRSLNMTIADCDFYRFLKDDHNNMELFYGQYMQNYSWAEATLAVLDQKSK